MTAYLVSALAMLSLAACAATSPERGHDCDVRVEVGRVSELTLQRLDPVREVTEQGISISNSCGRFSVTFLLSEKDPRETLRTEGVLGEWCTSPVDFENVYLIQARRDGNAWILESTTRVLGGYLDYRVISKKSADRLGLSSIVEPLWVSTPGRELLDESPLYGPEENVRLVARVDRAVEKLRSLRCAD